jgi:hypothetical protein
MVRYPSDWCARMQSAVRSQPRIPKSPSEESLPQLAPCSPRNQRVLWDGRGRLSQVAIEPHGPSRLGAPHEGFPADAGVRFCLSSIKMNDELSPRRDPSGQPPDTRMRPS